MTWTKLTGNGLPDGEVGRIGIAVYRKNSNIVIVSIEQGERYNASTAYIAYIARKAGVYRSEDKGATWRFMSDWNPRPMYGSQPTIDPNDDQRIYMLNAYSFSDDGGKTFTAPRTTTHGDDRFVWVDPRDGRHVVKLDDGGIGISYDRGVRFLYVPSLPLSQFYHVRVDNAMPFNVYGGLQDNGCWMGPSASWNTNGILNESWSRLCGGDGFYIVSNPLNWRSVYSASQFLGLQRNDTRTWQLQDIRPGDPQGHIAGRRNWNTWGKSGASETLGNAMHPAKWDSPVVLSPHDTSTLYVGMQHLFHSRDAGRTWSDQQTRFPGAPTGAWFAGVEASPHAAGTAYVVVDNHRSDDFRNYVYRTTDFGATWTSIVGDLPANRVARAVREDPRRPGLLYLATEFGAFVSPDTGARWIALRNNMPTMPFNDIVVHGRDNALVLGSHARGFWILDQINALQELTPAVIASPAHLFSLQPAYEIRMTNLRPPAGDMVFRGENPANGVLVDYWVATAGTNAALTVHDATGAKVQTLVAKSVRGINRVVWNLRYDDVPLRSGGGEDDEEGPRTSTPGPLVPPGTYRVRLVVNGATQEQRVVVRDDPHVTIASADRATWTVFHREIAALLKSYAPVADRVRSNKATDMTTLDRRRQAQELLSRIGTLYGAVSRWASAQTADQRTQLAYYRKMAAQLAAMP